MDEEELEADEQDKAPIAYLMVPDIRALRQIESFWRRWKRGETITGQAAWRNVFDHLRDLRAWGPNDRIQVRDGTILEEEIEGRHDDETIRLETELIFRERDRVSEAREQDVRVAIMARGGRVETRSRIADIAYHALLVDLPVRAVREIVQRSIEGIAGLEPVMHVRPQSSATSIELTDSFEADPSVEVHELGSPILALLDGVPVSAHPILSRHLVVDDQFGLEPGTLVSERVHGTAMASLIVHGDRNQNETPIPRRIHVVPVLGPGLSHISKQAVEVRFAHEGHAHFPAHRSFVWVSAQDVEGDPADDGEVFRRMIFACSGPILVKDDIELPMQEGSRSPNARA